MSPAVRLEGVGVRYGARHALADLHLEIGHGERVAVLGPSGAGKSTLLGVLNASVSPTEGDVEILGEPVGRLDARRLRRLRSRIGTISQRLDLIDQVRVVHNVNAGRLASWSTARALTSIVWPREVDVAHDALERVGLGWATWERTERLSGGERQRVAIARLMVQEPELVLADEPVSSLDPARSEAMLGLLVGELGSSRTVVVSLHQPEIARRHCTRALGLREGRVVFDCTTADLTDDHLERLYAAA